jgi:eukaryotic-like serine/threonine-protein kinase
MGDLGPAPEGRGVPAWIEPILRRGLHPDPDERWPGMGELLGALADDPDARRARTRRTAIIVAGVAAITATAAVAGTLMVRGGRVAPCQDQGAALAGIWDGSRRETLVRALADTGKPYALDTASRIARELDGRARLWTGMRTDACLATAVAQTQSAAMLDRRMACLDRRRAELGATVDLIIRDAAPSLPRALDSVLSLPPLDACDPDRVMTSAPPPDDPAARAAIAAARKDLDRGTALVRDGRTRDALAPAAAAVAAATRIGWPQLSAEALGIEARARLATGDTRDAEPELHAAIAAASTAGDADLQAELTVALVELANHEARYDDVVTLARLAEATLGSADRMWRDRAALETELGRAALSRQQLDKAGDHFGRALELRRRHAGNDSLAASRSLEDLADTALHGARWSEADTLLRQVLAIEERSLGPRHPEVATTLTNLSTAAKEQARYDEGVADLRRAIDILATSEGDDSPRLAAAWSNLGVILGYQERGDDALAAYQKALAIRERTLPPNHPDLASSILNVGIALQEDLNRPADAIPYFARARDLLERKLGPEHPSLAYALHGRGSSYLDLHQPTRAVADLERAYRLRSRPDVDPQLEADSGYMLAQALWESRLDRRRAVALAREAAAIYRRLGDLDGARQIDAWAAAHKP